MYLGLNSLKLSDHLSSLSCKSNSVHNSVHHIFSEKKSKAEEGKYNENEESKESEEKENEEDQVFILLSPGCL